MCCFVKKKELIIIVALVGLVEWHIKHRTFIKGTSFAQGKSDFTLVVVKSMFGSEKVTSLPFSRKKTKTFLLVVFILDKELTSLTLSFLWW